MNLIYVLYDKIVWYNARSKTIGYANLSVQITSPCGPHSNYITWSVFSIQLVWLGGNVAKLL